MLKLAVCVLLLAAVCQARIVSVSELKNALAGRGVSNDKLDTWACIVQHESEFNTAAYNGNTGDHGLFQISQIYWCSPPGQGCGMTCDSLRDDDINNDITCALTIFAEHEHLSGNGFNAWVAYQYCH